MTDPNEACYVLLPYVMQNQIRLVDVYVPVSYRKGRNIGGTLNLAIW